MIFVDYGIGKKQEHYLYLKEINDNDILLLNHLGFEPLDSNNGIIMEEPEVETWVKYNNSNEKELINNSNEPYLKYTVIQKKYNPNYGDNRMCICGHSYYRHFDSYENMEAIGCKYCCCNEFIEDTK